MNKHHNFYKTKFHKMLNADKTSAIKAKALLYTPNPNKLISAQINHIVLKSLPNPQVLKNDYFEMFISTLAHPVLAKEDGSFCYGPRSAEFAAVSVFNALMNQIELYLALGLQAPKNPLRVFINDPFIADNAYFEPERYEIHIGVGTGLKHGGLNKHIAYDLSVSSHEFGHTMVTLQTITRRLFGQQGAALNEAIADVLGSLVMEYLGKIWYAKEIGQEFTARDLENDSRIIGKYALPPLGIRSLRTNKRMPDDLTGEPHADGLIVGGALADLLIAMAIQSASSLKEQIYLFVRTCLLAMSLLLTPFATFQDMLQAMIEADQQISKGKYSSLIAECFAKHGITFDTMFLPNMHWPNIRSSANAQFTLK